MASAQCENISEDIVEQFCAITGATQVEGKRLLQVCYGNLDMAIGMHMDDTDGDVIPVSNDQQQGTSQAATRQLNHHSRKRTHQSYVDNSDGTDVRAPIPQKTEVLVQENYAFGLRGRRRPARSVFDGFRDFQAETRQREQEFLEQSSTEGIDRIAANQKRKTLEDLFRPPIDIMYKGIFHSAKDTGSSANKWLMVNIQNVQEFACQALNRDLWSNSAVKAIIKEHFIFWQVYHDSAEGNKYIQFYRVNEWPYVAILDPRTGENMVTLSRLDPVTFCDVVTDFLETHTTPDGTESSPPGKKMKREERESIVDASEDSQIEVAIRASLNQSGTNNTTSTTENQSISDSDESDLETFTDSDDNKNNSPRKQSPRKGYISKKSVKANNITQDSADKEDIKCTKNIDSSSEIKGWRIYLGSSEDPKSEIMLRFPNNTKEQISWPSTSRLKALVLYVIEKGFSNERYELITNFPKRRISDLDYEISLKEAGIFPQETIFVHER